MRRDGFWGQTEEGRCRLGFVFRLALSALRGACRSIQWSSKFTRTLAGSSSGGEVIAFSEMLGHAESRISRQAWRDWRVAEAHPPILRPGGPLPGNTWLYIPVAPDEPWAVASWLTSTFPRAWRIRQMG